MSATPCAVVRSSDRASYYTLKPLIHDPLLAYSLAQNGMGPEGVKYIARAIAVMPQLTWLECATSLLKLGCSVIPRAIMLLKPLTVFP